MDIKQKRVAMQINFEINSLDKREKEVRKSDTDHMGVIHLIWIERVITRDEKFKNLQ